MATQASNELGAVTNRISALQVSANQLNNLVTTINSSAAGSLSRVTDQTDRLAVVNQQVGNLSVPRESVATDQQSRAGEIWQAARSLREQVN